MPSLTQIFFIEKDKRNKIVNVVCFGKQSQGLHGAEEFCAKIGLFFQLIVFSPQVTNFLSVRKPHIFRRSRGIIAANPKTLHVPIQ